MSFLKNIFASTPSAPVNLHDCKVRFVEDTKPQGWLSWLVSFPFSIPERIYNTYLLITGKEMRGPLARCVSYERPVDSFASLFFTMRTSTCPAMMKAMGEYARNDREGIFRGEDSKGILFPILRDVFELEGEIDPNIYLLTCEGDQVQRFRGPIMEFIGSRSLKEHEGLLEEIVEETGVEWGKREGRFNATNAAMEFSALVISKFLLGSSYGAVDITKALRTLSEYHIRKLWMHRFSQMEIEDYDDALVTIRGAINGAIKRAQDGSFVSVLRERGLSELQIKTTVLLMYIAGFETTSGVLNYLLWQLGMNEEYQRKILAEINGMEGSLTEIAMGSETLDKAVAEALRLFTPAYLLSRQPSKNLVCEITDKDGNVHREKLAKGQPLLYTPTFAARDPAVFENPDEFNPDRFKSSPVNLSWLPFSSGVHACPGQAIGKRQILLLVAALVKKYTISSFPQKEIALKGNMTLAMDQDVEMELFKRNAN